MFPDAQQMDSAVERATHSNCVKAHVGAVMVIEGHTKVTGYNGTIKKYPNCQEGGCSRCLDMSLNRGEALDRCVCVHAEENAIVSAARAGISIDGADCFVTHEPCLGCTKLLIQLGLQRVVYLLDFEYDNTYDHNENRKALRDYSASHGGTSFVPFDRDIDKNLVDRWEEKLEELKADALARAGDAGLLTGRRS